MGLGGVVMAVILMIAGFVNLFQYWVSCVLCLISACFRSLHSGLLHHCVASLHGTPCGGVVVVLAAIGDGLRSSFGMEAVTHLSLS